MGWAEWAFKHGKRPSGLLYTGAISFLIHMLERQKVSLTIIIQQVVRVGKVGRVGKVQSGQRGQRSNIIDILERQKVSLHILI